jgi:bifunctional non-homologous end joining protein LigD
LRFGWIVEAAGKLRATSFVIDGEGVVLGQDDVSDFDQLHSRGHDGAVQPLAFDLQQREAAGLTAAAVRHVS